MLHDSEADDPGTDNGEHPVNVVLMWHMHQPQYQDQVTGEFFLPWTYLHAIKDYIDMATIVEENPNAKAVVNFTPVLLDQIDHYARQFDQYFDLGVAFKEPLLRALGSHVLSANEQSRWTLIHQCTRANEQRFIQRFTPFRQLVELARHALEQPQRVNYLNDQFIYDILVWYHLAWLGETVRSHNEDVRYLLKKERNFTFTDRKLLLQILQQTINQIVPKYRELAERGQLELSVTPDKHPILPLLIDFACAREALPDSPLPKLAYPGGKERARVHLEKAKTVFKAHFGFIPDGCWPSEGALSEAAVAMIEEAGFKWTASGGGVLANSLRDSGLSDLCIHHPFVLDRTRIRCFFRDDPLSDLIGFTYSSWNESDAVLNLIHHILEIRQACGKKPDTIVPIILDGENCWEYYNENGYHFLTQLYQKLSEHPDINLTTFKDYLRAFSNTTPLPKLTAGSWVYGNLSTWIGNEDKNRGWDLLSEAKQTYDRLIGQFEGDRARLNTIENQLAICEGSDWFWWFGDYNPANSVRDFDFLYRTHLKNLYRMLGAPIPATLDQTISVGRGDPENSGVMRRGIADD